MPKKDVTKEDLLELFVDAAAVADAALDVEKHAAQLAQNAGATQQEIADQAGLTRQGAKAKFDLRGVED